jgi:hypothetical protein
VEEEEAGVCRGYLCRNRGLTARLAGTDARKNNRTQGRRAALLCGSHMQQIILIHWNASEGTECARRLLSAGYDAELIVPRDSETLRLLRDAQPAAFAIDLSRLPSQGRAVATFLRQQRDTRRIPLVFIGGIPEKVARIRETLPDAVFSDWEGIREDLRRAISTPPADPAVPGTMDAYSGSPLHKKLGIGAGSTVLLAGAPPSFERKLRPMPEGVRFCRRASLARMALLFVKSQKQLEKRFFSTVRHLEECGRIWIVWPKKTSGIATDLTQAAVRSFGLASGFVDYKICAIDETWSGLLFTRRPRR